MTSTPWLLAPGLDDEEQRKPKKRGKKNHKVFGNQSIPAVGWNLTMIRYDLSKFSVSEKLTSKRSKKRKKRTKLLTLDWVWDTSDVDRSICYRTRKGISLVLWATMKSWFVGEMHHVLRNIKLPQKKATMLFFIRIGWMYHTVTLQITRKNRKKNASTTTCLTSAVLLTNFMIVSEKYSNWRSSSLIYGMGMLDTS